MWKEMILEFPVILEFLVMILVMILEFPINGKTWSNLH